MINEKPSPKKNIFVTCKSVLKTLYSVNSNKSNKNWYENVDIFKVYFSWTTGISSSIDFGFSKAANTTGLCELYGRTTDLRICILVISDHELCCILKMPLLTYMHNFRWEIFKEAKTSGNYSDNLLTQLMSFFLKLYPYELRWLN